MAKLFFDLDRDRRFPYLTGSDRRHCGPRPLDRWFGASFPPLDFRTLLVAMEQAMHRVTNAFGSFTEMKRVFSSWVVPNRDTMIKLQDPSSGPHCARSNASPKRNRGTASESPSLARRASVEHAVPAYQKRRARQANDESEQGSETPGQTHVGGMCCDRKGAIPGIFWAALLASIAGCHQGVYQAGSLPSEFVAPRLVSLDSFQLTHLGPGVADNEMIHPGDALQVRVIAGDESVGDDRRERSGWEVVVAEDGTIAVPLIGPLNVAGLSLAGAADAIRVASIRREIYRDPTVTATFSEQAVNRVTVAGAVQKPGTYELRAGSSTLAVALAAAEGLNEEASPIVEIQAAMSHRRPGFGPNGEATGIRQTSYNSTTNDPAFFPGPGLVRLNLLNASAAADGTASMNRYLQDGTIVTVMKRPERHVTMMGLTGNKVLPLPPGREVRLLDALSESGGLKYSNWIMDKVKVIRHVPGTGETITIKASVRKAKRNSDENILLAAGDVVSVEENIFTFTLSTVGSLAGIGYSAAQTAAVGGGL